MKRNLAGGIEPVPLTVVIVPPGQRGSRHPVLTQEVRQGKADANSC